MSKTFNVELGLDILEQVLKHPESHDQRGWVTAGDGGCGTTACVAGWAAVLTQGYRIKHSGGFARLKTADGEQVSFSRTGARLLGLKRYGHRYDALFFVATDEQSIRLLKYFIAHPGGDSLPDWWAER